MWNIFLCILITDFGFWIITMFILPRFLENTLIFKFKYLVLFSLHFFICNSVNRVWGNQQHCRYSIYFIWVSETPLNFRYVHVLKINNILLNEIVWKILIHQLQFGNILTQAKVTKGNYLLYISSMFGYNAFSKIAQSEADKDHFTGQICLCVIQRTLLKSFC